MSEDTEKLGVWVNGATVKKLTAFNAAYIRDNKIGPGAILKITRQGDAIPYIKEVIKQSPTGAQFPDKSKLGNYEWNDTNIDLVLVESENENVELQIQRIIRFFTAVDIEYFSEGNIRKFYKNGYKTIKSILEISDNDMKKLGGFQDKAIKRVKNEFNKLKTVGLDLPTYMYASGVFKRGLGKDKLARIYEEFGEDCVIGWDGMKLRDVAASVGTIHGLSETTGIQFAKGIQAFINFRNQTKNYITVKQPKTATGNRLIGTVAYLTGFRNPQISEFIVDQGGRIANSFGNSVTLLLVKNSSTANDKTVRAARRGITVVTEQDFKTKWNL